jgi:uncharacterized protein
VGEPDQTLTFAKDGARPRYTLHLGDDLVSTLDFQDDGSTVALTRAYTVPAVRGQGYAAEITDRAVAEIEARSDRRVDPVCPYVAEWFRQHPERAGVLATGTAAG